MKHANIIKNIFIIILMGLLTSCGTFKETPTKDINNIQESETELSLVLWQAPSAHHALAKTRTITKYHVSNEIILCVISIDEPLYAGKKINGQYIKIGTYTYIRADKKETPQTVAAFIRKEEFQKYGATYLKEYFLNIEFFIKEPQPQENQNTEPKHQYLVTYAAKKGKLCAGSLLGKLKKRGLVTDRFVDKMYWKYFLTREGRIAMFEYETKDFTSIDESRKLLAEGKDIFSAEKYYQHNRLPETGGWYLLPVPDFEKQAAMDLRDRFFQVYKADVARGAIVPAWRK